MMTAHPLETSLDTAAAAPLSRELLARIEAGQPLTVDGDKVKRAGLACLQVLAAARAEASARGLGYTLDRPSGALRDMVALAGLPAVLEPIV